MKNLMKTLFLFVTFVISFNMPVLAAQLEDGLYSKLDTNQGEILLKLAFEKTPLTVVNFVSLAEGTKKSNKPLGTPFYNGLKFHRVINDFMIQGGDPQGNGRGGPGYKFADEITDLKHDSAGILSMANSGPNTNGSQFFITHNATPWLDGKHTVFGKVVKGMSVVNAIKKDDFIRKVEIIRIGKTAQSFKTDEAAFINQQEKYQAKVKVEKAKQYEEFIRFVKQTYPTAKMADAGYFVNTTKHGDGKQVKNQDLVSIALGISLSNGIVLQEAGKSIDFALNDGQVIPIINDTVAQMKVHGKRIIIANYEQVYGDAQRVNLPQDAILIFTIELQAIKTNTTGKANQ